MNLQQNINLPTYQWLIIGFMLTLIIGISFTSIAISPWVGFLWGPCSVVLCVFLLKKNYCFYLLLFALQFKSLYIGRICGQEVILLYVIPYLAMAFMVSSWLISIGLHGSRSNYFKMELLDISILLFFTYSATSLLWTADLKNGLIELVRFALTLTIAIITRSLINSRQSLNTVIWIILTTSIANAVIAIWASYSFPDFTSYYLTLSKDFSLYFQFNETKIGARGHAFGYPLATAVWLNLGILIGLGKTLADKGKSRRLLLAIATFFILVGMMQTDSKGTVLSLLGSVALICILYKPLQKFLLSGGFSTIFIFLLAFFLSHISRLKTGIKIVGHQLNSSSEFTSVGSRLNWWKQGIEACIDSDLFGVGIGGSHQLLNPWGPHIHNIYVSAFTELGLFGILFFICIHGLACIKWWHSMKQIKDPKLNLWVLIFGINYINILLYSMTSYDFTELNLWFFMGLMLAVIRLAEPNSYRLQNV